MVSLVASVLLLSFQLFSLSWAAPAVDLRSHKTSIFCSPRDGAVVPDVSTSIGTAHGAVDGDAVRFSVKYANAARWEESKLVSSWQLPNNSSDVTALPLGCPQDDLDQYSEDCLSMVLYVPATATVGDDLPIFMWIHGGSFYFGSSNDYGLDGASLAVATNSIVAVIQYRLGALGWMAPSGATNLALKDAISAMKFLQTVGPSFGGSASKITVAGQSSGANMIRALLAVPSASSLFTSAIIESDPMNYGFLSPATQVTLQTYFNSAIGCSSTDSDCLNALSLADILSAQSDLMGEASDLDAAAGAAEPIRPVQDGTLITSPLDDTGAFPAVTKSILVTTVKNEAGATIQQNFPNALPEAYFSIVTEGLLGSDRTTTIMASDYYSSMQNSDGDTDARVALEVLGTDEIWRCPTWTFARNWAAHGGRVYVGEFTVGAVYEGNAFSYCYEEGSVCHQADIEIVFGSVASPTTAQSALITEVQARYKSFMHDGTPNPSGYPSWATSDSVTINALNLGGTDDIPLGACDPSFWGDAVEYDYQIYDI